MILIFYLSGGFTDMLRDLVSINKFTILHKINFTIQYASNRPIHNPNIWNTYNIDELFDESSFIINDFYINYNTIKNKITTSNTYNFYKDKINGNLWDNDKQQYLNDIYFNILDFFKECNKEYIIMCGGFWYYSNLDNIDERLALIKHIKPSKKILLEYEKNKVLLPINYNLIHYRYEDDWIPNLKISKTPYIIPPIDELIKYIPFNEKYDIYICCSMIETLNTKNLMYNKLSDYKNIIKKLPNNLNYDENAFLDFLIGINAQEFYGNSISGFSVTLNSIKKTKNYYNEMYNKF
jgi:hypothetical protein